MTQLDDDAAPVVADENPVGQVVHAAEETAFAEVEYVPAGQLVHDVAFANENDPELQLPVA